MGVWRKGFREPAYGVARFAAYAQTKKEGGLTAMWQRMPDVMIAKCAEALALRKAFPQELSGLYTGDEMAQAQPVPPPEHIEVVDTLTGEIVADEKAITLGPDQFYVRDVTVLKSGIKGERPWELFGLTLHTGQIVQTFDAEIAKSAEEAKRTGRAVEIQTEKAAKGDGLKVISLMHLFKDAEEKIF